MCTWILCAKELLMLFPKVNKQCQQVPPLSSIRQVQQKHDLHTGKIINTAEVNPASATHCWFCAASPEMGRKEPSLGLPLCKRKRIKPKITPVLLAL